MDGGKAANRLAAPPTISLVTAGAGTGKTYHVTQAIAETINADVPPESLLATTFTRKAAAELSSRVHSALAARAGREVADALPEALIGTVNGVCGRLVEEFAFEAGLSPDLTVLDELGESAAFGAAVSTELARREAELGPVARRMGMGGGPNPSDVDWRDMVRHIAKAARYNLIDAEGLRTSAARSLAPPHGLLGRLGNSSSENAEALDEALSDAILGVLSAAWSWDHGSLKKGTQKALEKLSQFRQDIDNRGIGNLPWSAWASLSKDLGAEKALASTFRPINEAAAAHDRHPRLRTDIETLVCGCFEAAASALDAYQAYKRAEGLLDFCDQETLALRLLERQDVAEALSQRLRLVVVDEFQDTSPLQLALFLRLASLSPRSLWVGDSKQCIFGFRNADPAMTDAVVAGLPPPQGTPPPILSVSRRSRPELVAFANHLFAPVFGAHGMPSARVRLSAHRSSMPGQAPSLAFWRIVTTTRRKVEERAEAVAAGVARLVSGGATRPVVDRRTGDLRPLRAGDVAVLCRSNAGLSRIAAALQARGLRVAATRSGLLETAEVRLALAALRRLASASDSLAAAEIMHLNDPAGGGDWLRDRLAARASGNNGTPWPEDQRVQRLDAAREAGQGSLSAAAALRVAMAEGDVLRTVSHWPEASQRLGNLEALHTYAAEYEEACRSARQAASPTGFVAWLTERDRQGEGCQQPEAFGDDAVSVLTYHRSKGLEWPAVVLTDLDHARSPDVFGVHVEGLPVSLDEPLAGRWVRFWPWPYGSHSSLVALGDRADATPEFKDVAEARQREDVRLAYVGVTRARDYLVLAADPGDTAWLARVSAPEAAPMTFPAVGTTELSVPGETPDRIPIEVSEVRSETSVAAATTGDVHLVPWPGGSAPMFAPARLTPSALVSTGAAPDGVMIELGDRLPFSGPDQAMADVGEAVHRFLAADRHDRPPSEREAMAASMLQAWGVDSYVAPVDVVLAADRFWAWLFNRYGENTLLLREWPVQACRADGVEMHGRIDLLVVHRGGLAVIDHKSFPGRDAEERAASYVPQLQAYVEAVEGRGVGLVTEIAVHLPILGRAFVYGCAAGTAGDRC